MSDEDVVPVAYQNYHSVQALIPCLRLAHAANASDHLAKKMKSKLVRTDGSSFFFPFFCEWGPMSFSRGYNIFFFLANKNWKQMNKIEKLRGFYCWTNMLMTPSPKISIFCWLSPNRQNRENKGSFSSQECFVLAQLQFSVNLPDD